MKVWTISNHAVRRHGLTVALYRRMEDDALQRFMWRGFGMERHGFATEGEVLVDVKHFYRYRPAGLRITFKSGRVIEL